MPIALEFTLGNSMTSRERRVLPLLGPALRFHWLKANRIGLVVASGIYQRMRWIGTIHGRQTATAEMELKS